MKAVVTTPPGSRPVTWALAKAHLRIDADDQQTYVESLIDAATAHAEASMECSLVTQTITATFYASDPVHLPNGPVSDVLSVIDGASRSIGDYDLETVGHSDRLSVGAFQYPLTVVYTAGYASASAVPADIRHAILCHVATLFERRESVTEKALANVPHQLAAFYRLRKRTTGIG